MQHQTLFVAISGTLAALSIGSALAADTTLSSEDLQALTSLQRLGQQIFFDSNLSEPAGQSCASCHDAKVSFTYSDLDTAVADGAVTGRSGTRNVPSAMYAGFTPPFRRDNAGNYVGGQFWDGRAVDLAEQAKGPFLNADEMNNPDAASVIAKIRRASYAGLFTQVFGAGALNNASNAYDQVAQAIAAFEGTQAFNRFSSKFDAVQAGQAQFTTQEATGLALFQANGKGRCGACHDPNPRNNSQPVFSNFSYHNVGVPANPEIRAVKGADFVDLGLGAVVNDPAQDGKFKTQGLRNIAKTAPYMHNGVFASLREVVEFYNSRDVDARWPAPETRRNVDRRDTGNLGLSNAEIDALVAFMRTLSDGYSATTEAAYGDGILTLTHVKLDTGQLPSPVYSVKLQSSGGSFRLMDAAALPASAAYKLDAMPTYVVATGVLEIPTLTLAGAQPHIIQMQTRPSGGFEFDLSYAKPQQ